jgi:hypothetical protein
MGLSRLDNFLKSTRGEILYVDPSSIDSTDSIENKGNSLTRPFKTIQRALVEAARFSYQRGTDNDRFGKTTILLYPGEHIVDNRPGWIPDSSLGVNQYRLRNGTSSDDFSPFNINTDFNINSENNALYKLNSIYGGVIIPRGTSIVGYDLRKTKIRPRYVPNPDDVDGANIERSAIFRVTGACYLWQFTIFDADPGTPCYIDYTTNTFFPRFSHHKLTCFEYADGINKVAINDQFIRNFSTDRTDLDIYYEKIGIAYGETSDRGIEPDYPSSQIDIQPKIDEFLIVGSRGEEVGITSIRAGDGVDVNSDTSTITVQLSDPFPNLDINSPIQIQGVPGYNGQQVVSKVNSLTEIEYKVQVPPLELNVPSPSGATVSLILDTVNSASPYIFNCSLRSVYGMCGLHADGDKAGGFKSMVVAQFTGIGLQKDNNAFVKYNKNTGEYVDQLATGDQNIYSDSLARHKPTYESVHIKCSNNAFIQVVSVFAIGFTRHFLSESGGDLSITNSNSNFGANSLTASGFRNEAFSRDDVGYITHIIPPREIEENTISLEYDSIDSVLSLPTNSKLYLYNRNVQTDVPNSIIDGYRIGAKTDEYLNLTVNGITYSARVVVPGPNGFVRGNQKSTKISKSGSLNNIVDSVFTCVSAHNLSQGEKIRITSENGYLPDGVENDTVYYAITTGSLISGNNQFKLAKSLNDAFNDRFLNVNSRGGNLKVVSRVSDKKSGDPGHPIQWDSFGWYISVDPSDNTISSPLILTGTATSRTFITRTLNQRSLTDSIYRLRYVIPASSNVTARPPTGGFIIEESNKTTGSTDNEVTKYLRDAVSPTSLQNISELRNFRFISDASWSNNIATIRTELPHDLFVGSTVEIKGIESSENEDATDKIGYNGTFEVTEVLSRRTFRYSLLSNPGEFLNNVSVRNRNLPKFSKKGYNEIYSIYNSEEIQEYIRGEQDGIYHLTVTNSSNSPAAAPFNNLKLSQPILNLYPRINRDEPDSDPQAAKSFAVPNPIGKVVVSDAENSITKETIEKSLLDFGKNSQKIDNIISVGIAGTLHQFNTDLEHGLNRVISVSVNSPGTNYGTAGLGVSETFFNAQLVSTTGFGSEASGKVVVNSSGQLVSVQIMDGGSGYQVGDLLNVVGITTRSGGHTPGVVQVSKIYNNVGDNFKITGIIDDEYEKYNRIYRVNQITGSKTFNAYSVGAISNPAIGSGIGQTASSEASLSMTGKSLPITAISYDSSSGIAIFATSQTHGLSKGNKVVISGANDDLFNGEQLILATPLKTTFSANVGIKSTAVTTGSPRLNYDGVSSRSGTTSSENENVFERMIFNYGNITSYLTLGLNSDLTSTTLSLNDVYDFEIGDFLLVNKEIMRISSTVTSSSQIQVQRALLGTVLQSHSVNDVVRKINVFPIEFRRNSIIRAGGHTFEYLGFGPGNYSSAFPEKQDRELSSQEELLSQSSRFGAGAVIYTGMNSDGDFYIGNKKISATGKGETFDTPIPSFTGEADSNEAVEYITPDIVSISKSLTVEGGPEANNISKFNGPVIFNEKITSNSSDGIEANNILLQGDASISRKVTVGISTPTIAGNPGDVIFDAFPNLGGNVGWVYTTDGRWARFGGISLSDTSDLEFFDRVVINRPGYTGTDPLVIGSGTNQFTVTSDGRVGIGTNPDTDTTVGLKVDGKIVGDGSGLTGVSDIWVVSPVVDRLGNPVVPSQVGITTITPVGINTTNPRKDFGLYVEGTMAINGSLRVFEIIERADIDTRVLGTELPSVDIYLADNNVYYFTNVARGNWTINFLGDSTKTAATGLLLGGTNGFLNVGESMTVAIITKQGATAYYNNSITIDGFTVQPYYYGGETLNSGNPGVSDAIPGIDVYTYVIIRNASGGGPDSEFTVLYSQSQYKR